MFCASTFLENTECDWIINVKTFFMYAIWKIIQLNVSRASQIAQKFAGWLKFQGELIF